MDEAPDVNVRAARPGDAQPIGAVFDAAVREAWRYLGKLVDEPLFSPADWDQLVADHTPPNELLVATDHAGRVVGYVAAHPEDGELFLLFVHPASAGRGVGRRLLEAAHDAMRSAGRAESFLFTHELNERAPGERRGEVTAAFIACIYFLVASFVIAAGLLGSLFSLDVSVEAVGSVLGAVALAAGAWHAATLRSAAPRHRAAAPRSVAARR